MIAKGMMSGTGALFSPTRAATRETLAVALYALAGSPETQDYSFGDVSPEDPAYPAICYTLDLGLFSQADTFSPQQSLTREMLAVVLRRTYEQVYGGEVLRLEGLGSFSDGDQVADWARTAMGWALAEGLITPQSSALHPQGAVSRGELARSLTAFLRCIGEIT
jgi:hypothetical protein